MPGPDKKRFELCLSPLYGLPRRAFRSLRRRTAFTCIGDSFRIPIMSIAAGCGIGKSSI
ncbi:hypothetical protein C7S14_2641 [Burkholderia cepacia]|nr:hypothetical protein [Burkholderia cepacia]QOH39086.1 hypothetical protein C7S14_2641 [Burkholderia cepacia]